MSKKGPSCLSHVVEMLWVGETSCDQATLRQMALLEEVLVMLPTSIDCALGFIVEYCWNSNLSKFNPSPFSFSQQTAADIWSYAPEVVSVPQRTKVGVIDIGSGPGGL